MSEPAPPSSVIRKRWSPRAFADRAVDKSTQHTLFEAARWAPSSFNEQPWRFVVASSDQPEPFGRLADCLLEGNAWAKKAPLLIFTAAKKTFSHNGKPNGHAWHDLGLATAQLMAQATALSLHCHPMGGFDREKARKELNVPEDFELVAALAVGHLGNWRSLSEPLQKREVSARTRRSLEQLVHHGSWGKEPDFGHSDWQPVLSFWFGELDENHQASPQHRAGWWKKDPKLDAEIRDRFEGLLKAIVRGEKNHWLANAEGTLAAVIVLDQFSRNIYRDTAEMYAADDLALRLVGLAIDAGLDWELSGDLRTFLYMPLMHAETLEAQNRCVELFARFRDSAPEKVAASVNGNVDYAIRHRDIVERFGRFPHRNAILGRESTAEELAFLQEPGSSF